MRGTIHPALVAGLAALCVEETDSGPLRQFSELMLRRAFRVRDKAMTAPLHQIVQVAPVDCDLHCQVFALLYNIWCLDGPVKDLVNHILADKTLKLKYWPNHVNTLCKRFNIPGIESMFKLDPPTKKAFKVFANEKIKDFYTDKLKAKIQRSSSLRLIHPDDFDFQDRKLSPLISTAYTRREIVAMKINILHLLGEYKNGQNLFRLKQRKSPSCEYCEDDLDSSEHALLRCGVVTADKAMCTQLQLLVDWLADTKSVTTETILSIVSAEFETFARWILNPLSRSNTGILKLDLSVKGICNLIRYTQEFILKAHNLRSKAKKIRDVSKRRKTQVPTWRRGRSSRKTGPGGLPSGRDVSSTFQSMKHIKSYFSSNNQNGKAATSKAEAAAMTFTEADRQRMSEGGVSYGKDAGVQLIAMMAGGHINPVVTVRTTDYGRHISSTFDFDISSLIVNVKTSTAKFL